MLPKTPANRKQFGLNLLERPRATKALLQSGSNGEAVLSDLIQRPADHDPTIFLTQAAYRSEDSTPPRSLDQLNEAVLGWGFGIIDVDSFIAQSLATVDDPHLAGSHVLLFDAAKPSKESLLFDPSGAWNQSWYSHPNYQTINVGGRIWTIGVQLTPAMPGPHRLHWSQALIVSIGSLLTVIATLVTQQLTESHRRVSQSLIDADKAAEERALASTVFEGTLDGVVITNAEGKVVSVNQSFTQLTGYTTQDLQGGALNVLRSGRHEDDFYEQLWQDLREKGHWQAEIWNRIKDGSTHRHDVSISTVRDKDLNPIFFVATYHDITRKYAEQAEILYQATHDALTGLANRTLLVERLDHGVAMARRYQHRLAVLFMDLNGFKPVNDNYGHATGDLLLKAVAQRLSLMSRDMDTLCRLGGDEFVLLLPEAPDQEEVIELARRLGDSVSAPYNNVLTPLGEPIRVSTSIGIAFWPADASTADELLDAADRAMYTSKQRGGREPVWQRRAPSSHPRRSPNATSCNG